MKITPLLLLLAVGCATAPRPGATASIPPPGKGHLAWDQYYRTTYPELAHKVDPAIANARPWPAGYDPKTNPVFAHNEIFIRATPAAVFAEILRAQDWGQYYENARDMKLLPDAAGHTPEVLGPATRFTWTSFGTPLESEITEFEKDRTLAWTARGGTPTIEAYHRWLLIPENGGTRLVTEECNKAPIDPALRWAVNAFIKQSGHPEALPAAHQHWLEGVKQRVESEPGA